MSDASTIYLVTGTCGEYSDRSEWYVCWYPTLAEAEAHVALCRAQVSELGEEGRYDYDKQKKIMTADPYFQSDYTGTEYAVCEVERGAATPATGEETGR